MSVKYCYRAIAIVGFLHLSGVAAWSAPWNLPAAISDRNTEVSFQVDSTWHLIKGGTKGITGKIWLADPLDYLSLRAEMAFPVGGFVTGNSSRDERLQEVMHATQFPQVKFRVNGARGFCAPETLGDQGGCKGTLSGDLEISGKTLQLDLPVEVRREKEGFLVTGDAVLHWRDFGVEDPSILIAKLHEEVAVHIKVTLESQSFG